MSACWDDTWARAEADRIGAMLRSVEPFDRGFGRTDLGRRKMQKVLDRHRSAARFFRGPGDPGFCLIVSTPTPGPFSVDNPDHMNAPIILPSWDQRLAFVVRTPWTISQMLGDQKLLRAVGTLAPGASSRLKLDRCSWHEGPAKSDRLGRKGPSLLTITTGQYIGMWWVCAHCHESLERRYPDQLSWHTPPV